MIGIGFDIGAHILVTTEVMKQPTGIVSIVSKTQLNERYSLDLSQASFGQYPLQSKSPVSSSILDPGVQCSTYLCVDIGDLLNSASLARPAVLCSNDTSIGPLPQLLLKHILRIYDKSRVECLERVPLHDGVFQVETKEQEEKERRKR